MIKDVFGDYPYLSLEDGYKEQILLRDKNGSPLFCMLEHQKGDCKILEFSTAKGYENFDFTFKHTQEHSFSISQIIGYTADAIVLFFTKHVVMVDLVQNFEERMFRQ